MKTIFKMMSLIFLNLAMIPNIYAQVDTLSDDDLLNGFDYEPVHSSTPSNAYKVIGIGYSGNMFFTKLDDLNKELQANFELPELKTPIFMHRVGVYLALDPTKNFSIGYNYASGSKKVEKSLSGGLQGYTRYLDYSVTSHSAELDYAIVPFKDFAILIGSSIGYSKIGIEYSQVLGDYQYPTQFTPVGDANTKYQKMDGSFFFAEPHLVLQYKLASNFMFKASGGYSFAFSPNWKLNNSDAEIKNVPTSLKPEGVVAQVGLYVGIFDF